MVMAQFSNFIIYETYRVYTLKPVKSGKYFSVVFIARRALWKSTYAINEAQKKPIFATEEANLAL
jgi:hypothetical protein